MRERLRRALGGVIAVLKGGLAFRCVRCGDWVASCDGCPCGRPAG